MTLDAGALIDHVGGDMVDSVKATLTGVPLPAFSLPGLPFRVDPGAGVSGMDFTLRGDQVDARWTLRSSSAAWRRDSSAVQSPVANLIWRVVSGLHELDVTAEMTGPLRAPRFTVHSNIGVAIADQVRAIIGDEVRKAEAKVRAEVDRLVADQVARVRTQVNTATSELTTRIPAAREELDSVKTLLEARLKSLTGIGGALGLPR